MLQDNLNHFRQLSRDLEAARLGYLKQSENLREQLGALTEAITHKENAGLDARKEKESLRLVKKERNGLKAPSTVDPRITVEEYAERHKRDQEIEPIQVKISAGQTPLAAHNDSMARTNEILAQIERVKAAPTTDIDIAAKIDAIATPPRIVSGDIQWPKHIVDTNGVAVTTINVPGILAWLHRDELVAALEVARPVEGGMSAAEKTKELGTLMAHWLKALRYESAAAMEAEKAGQRVIRRRHVHPAIHLSLAVSPLAAWDWFTKKRGA